MIRLESLGQRICVMGPSNSGKSTLASAIAARKGLTAVHLDRLFHEPHTDWKPRPNAEFLKLHEQAIQEDSWVMDGNYSQCIAKRLTRATGFILLDVSTPTSLLRYFRRTWFERDRAGALQGRIDSVKWQMIRHIAVATPRNRQRYAQLFDCVNVPKLKLPSTAAIHRFYQMEQLDI